MVTGDVEDGCVECVFVDAVDVVVMACVQVVENLVRECDRVVSDVFGVVVFQVVFQGYRRVDCGFT